MNRPARPAVTVQSVLAGLRTQRDQVADKDLHEHIDKDLPPRPCRHGSTKDDDPHTDVA